MGIGRLRILRRGVGCGIGRDDGVGIWDVRGGGDGFVGRVSESGLWGLVCGETSLGDFLILCGFRRF